jgi:hypothetical protein
MNDAFKYWLVQGNTCFMNSIMQIMLRVPGLRDHFLLGEHHRQCRVAQLATEAATATRRRQPLRNATDDCGSNNPADSALACGAVESETRDPVAWERPWTTASPLDPSASLVDTSSKWVAAGVGGGAKVRVVASGNKATKEATLGDQQAGCKLPGACVCDVWWRWVVLL